MTSKKKLARMKYIRELENPATKGYKVMSNLTKSVLKIAKIKPTKGK